MSQAVLEPWPPLPGAALTYRDLARTPDDGQRYEVIDGALRVTPFPTTAHQRAATRLTALLDAHVEKLALGMVFAAGLKVVLDERTGVGPDIVYVSKARLGGLARDGYYGPPDLLVEVLSSRPSLDTEVKMAAYARAQVPHYWIVDPERYAVRAYELDHAHWELVAERRDDDAFEPALFPGLVIALGSLWLR
jgi:Uma2 family endonuclease